MGDSYRHLGLGSTSQTAATWSIGTHHQAWKDFIKVICLQKAAAPVFSCCTLEAREINLHPCTLCLALVTGKPGLNDAALVHHCILINISPLLP